MLIWEASLYLGSPQEWEGITWCQRWDFKLLAFVVLVQATPADTCEAQMFKDFEKVSASLLSNCNLCFYHPTMEFNNFQQNSS